MIQIEGVIELHQILENLQDKADSVSRHILDKQIWFDEHLISGKPVLKVCNGEGIWINLMTFWKI